MDLVESSKGGDSCTEKWCDIRCLKKFPCTSDFRVFSDKSMVNLGHLLDCTVANEDPSCKRATSKFLLEFKSDSFCKHEDGKVVVNSQTHIWSVSFSPDEATDFPIAARSCISSYHNMNVHSPYSRQVEISVLKSVNGSPEICPNIYVHLSADHLSFLEVKLRELKADLIQPTNLTKGLCNSSLSLRTMMSALMPSGDFGVNLPVGKIIAMQGDVVVVHSSNQSRILNRLNHQVLRGQRHFVPEVAKSICIHVLLEHIMLKIYSSLSEYSYPIGFGPCVKAKFHRVLLTTEGDLLKLTPASFIEINSVGIDNDQCRNESEDTPVKSVVETATALTTCPATLIYEIMQFSYQKQMRFHYRHWIKDFKFSTRVKDQKGHLSFALVNKATGQAMKL